MKSYQWLLQEFGRRTTPLDTAAEKDSDLGELRRLRHDARELVTEVLQGRASVPSQIRIGNCHDLALRAAT